jgi:hypothetical protein
MSQTFKDETAISLLAKLFAFEPEQFCSDHILIKY